MANLAVIPARGGSIRIHRKNIKDFRGHPLITWTISAAKESGMFDRIIVTTDDYEIARVANVYEAEVYNRDPELADEHTPVSKATLDVAKQYPEYDNVCQLLPTCPLRDAEDISQSYHYFVAHDQIGSLISVTDYGWQNPWWAVTSSFQHINLEAVHKRSQDLEKLYCITGAVWWIGREHLLEHETFYTGHERPFIMDWAHGIDIDTMDDWELATALGTQ